MTMAPYRPERILVQQEAWQDQLTHTVLGRLPGVPVMTIRHPDEALPELALHAEPRTSGKRTLILSRFPGSFLKKCPGEGAEICCNYYVVNFASNCHLECTYCVLQAFLNHPAIQIFTNSDDLVEEVRRAAAQSPRRVIRIGTGELADSLALDAITSYSSILVPFFAGLPNALLELKTKSDQIAGLEGLEHRGRTVVSWSLNAETICLEEELKTPGMEERLAAARCCQEWGYPVGFHFDPIVWFEGWEGEYRAAIRRMFEVIDPNRVAWISLGALRFTPALKEIVRQRFPQSRIPYGEFVPGHHGKLRYFRPMREEMYLRIRGWIREAAPAVFVYLCMESRTAWKHGLGSVPCDSTDLSDQMDALVRLDP